MASLSCTARPCLKTTKKKKVKIYVNCKGNVNKVNHRNKPCFNCHPGGQRYVPRTRANHTDSTGVLLSCPFCLPAVTVCLCDVASACSPVSSPVAHNFLFFCFLRRSLGRNILLFLRCKRSLMSSSPNPLKNFSAIFCTYFLCNYQNYLCYSCLKLSAAQPLANALCCRWHQSCCISQPHLLHLWFCYRKTSVSGFCFAEVSLSIFPIMVKCWPQQYQFVFLCYV